MLLVLLLALRLQVLDMLLQVLVLVLQLLLLFYDSPYCRCELIVSQRVGSSIFAAQYYAVISCSLEMIPLSFAYITDLGLAILLHHTTSTYSI